MTTVVITVGNPYRGDDGAGPAVAASLRARGGTDRVVVETDGEPARMVEAWTGADVAYLVDAVRSGRVPAGTVHRVVLGAGGPDLRPGSGGTHGLGPGDAVALGTAVGRLPGQLVILAIEGEHFDLGDRMSPAVAAAVEALADELAVVVA